MINRLVLGTVQLGMQYGINNKHGQPNKELAQEIILTAVNYGIKVFDTAQAYGESESILGQALYDLGLSHDVDIISKFNPKLNFQKVNVLLESIKESLSRLKVTVLSGFMIHDQNWLDDWEHDLAILCQECFKQGLVRRFGASVYSPARALEALDKKEITFIQVPSNILDLRFEKAGVFEKAKKLQKTVYIRSVFLQGILCMHSSELPSTMGFARAVIEKFNSLADELGIAPRALALKYALYKWPQSFLVLGVERPEQIIDNTRLLQAHFLMDWIPKIEETMGFVDERIINPMMWPK